MCCIDWVLSIAIECELIRKATLSMQARIRSDDDVILLNQMIDPLTPPRYDGKSHISVQFKENHPQILLKLSVPH